MIGKSISRLWAWLCGLFGNKPLYDVVVTEELPDHPKPNKLYVIGDRNNHWMAAMICPCGCGDLIQLATDSKGRPRWTVQLDNVKAVTLHPSVHRKVGCRSHFWLRAGKVVWC